MIADMMLVLPEIILAAGAIAALMLATFAGNRAVAGYQAIALATLVAAMTAAAARFGEPAASAFAGTMTIDSFAVFAKLLIFGASIICVALAPRFFGATMRGEYPVLILLAAMGMGIMVSSRDLLTLYLGLELNSLSAYVLASFMRNDERSSEAGLKYFVLGALASGILLYGISLVYGFTGTTGFAGIAAAMQGELSLGLTFGIVFVLAAMAFKVSAVPFHMWTPDVYQGAPTPVTAFFASAPKVAAVAMLTRLLVDGMGPAMGAWQQIVIFLALASIILGAVGAISQTSIKRLLAYSSINNVGFMLIAVAAGSVAGVAAVLTYLLVYVVTVLGTFLAVLQLRDADGEPVDSIPALAGLAEHRGGAAAALAVFLFSMAGLPPLFGFWPKYLAFEAAWAAGLVPLAIVGIVASVIGAYYYIAIIKVMYFDARSDTDFAPALAIRWDGAVMTVAALWLAVLGYLFIIPLGNWSATAAQELF